MRAPRTLAAAVSVALLGALAEEDRPETRSYSQTRPPAHVCPKGCSCRARATIVDCAYIPGYAVTPGFIPWQVEHLILTGTNISDYNRAHELLIGTDLDSTGDPFNVSIEGLKVLKLDDTRLTALYEDAFEHVPVLDYLHLPLGVQFLATTARGIRPAEDGLIGYDKLAPRPRELPLFDVYVPTDCLTQYDQRTRGPLCNRIAPKEKRILIEPL